MKGKILRTIGRAIGRRATGSQASVGSALIAAAASAVITHRALRSGG